MDLTLRAAERRWRAEGTPDAAAGLRAAGVRVGGLPEEIVEPLVAERSPRAVEALATLQCWSGLGRVAVAPDTDGRVATLAFQAAIRPWAEECLRRYGAYMGPGKEVGWLMHVTHLAKPLMETFNRSPLLRYAGVSISWRVDGGRSGSRAVRFVTRLNPVQGMAYAFIVLRPSARGAPGDVLSANGHRGPRGNAHGNVFAADNGITGMSWAGPGPWNALLGRKPVPQQP